MKILLHLSKKLLSKGIRGGTRFTLAAAQHFRSFQTQELQVKGGTLFVDLRNAGGREIFVSPKKSTPEHIVMARVVCPGDTIFDIGANAGLFTVWLSSLVGPGGKVFAFEPNPGYMGTLTRTIELLSNAKLVPLALSDSEGEMEFFVPGDDTMASLKDWTNGQNGIVKKIECRASTIDALMESGEIDKADFVKCDIEGGELDCFRGGLGLFNQVEAPIVLFEANSNSTRGFGNSISAAFDLLQSLPRPQYSFFLCANSGRLVTIEKIDFQHGNVLACPKSKVNRIRSSTD